MASIPTPSAVASNRSFREGWKVQTRTIAALLLRELGTRYGRENIGYLWMIGEPMMLASVITLVHVAQPSHYGNDITPAPFAIIGYTIYIIFRGVFNRAEGSIELNRPLLFHRQISILDTTIVRSIVEVTGCFGSMVVLLSLAIALGLADFPYRPLHLLCAVAMMTWWSVSLSMIAAALTHGSETLGRQLHVIAYFSIPVSGAFFMLSWTPSVFRHYLEWFPMPLIMEQARYGQFRSAEATYVDPAYVAAWCAGLTYLGLLLTRRIRHQLH